MEDMENMENLRGLTMEDMEGMENLRGLTMEDMEDTVGSSRRMTVEDKESLGLSSMGAEPASMGSATRPGSWSVPWKSGHSSDSQSTRHATARSCCLAPFPTAYRSNSCRGSLEPVSLWRVP